MQTITLLAGIAEVARRNYPYSDARAMEIDKNFHAFFEDALKDLSDEDAVSLLVNALIVQTYSAIEATIKLQLSKSGYN
jgi:hypothetical protein